MALLQQNTALVVNTMMAEMIGDLFDTQSLATKLGIINPVGDIVGRDSETVKVPKRGSLTQRTKTAGSDFTFDNATSSLLTFGTFKQPYGAFTLETTAFQLLSEGKTKLVEGFFYDEINGLIEGLDTDFLNLYSSLSTSQSASDLDDAAIRAAKNTLDNAKVPKMQRYMVMSSDLMNQDILSEAKNASYNRADGIGAPATATITQGSVGSYRGFEMFDTPLLPVTSGSPDTHHVLAFQRGALGVQFGRLYSIDDLPGAQVSALNYNGAQFRTAFTYDFNADRYKVRIDMLYAVGILWDEKGLVINVTE